MTTYRSINQNDDSDVPINYTPPIANQSSSKKWYAASGSFVSIIVLMLLNRGRASNLENGSTCFSDGNCESSVCAPISFFGTVGKCVTCRTRIDCVTKLKLGQPPAGEFGADLCVDNKCQAYANGESTQIPNSGYPVWAPSETIDNAKVFRKYNMPRTVYSNESTPVFEHVWYIDFNDQDLSFNKDDVNYNGTHIEIPNSAMIHAGYSKSYHMYDEHETGISTLVTFENPYSLVADYPKLSFTEKLHTLTYDGKKDTARGDYIKPLSEEGMKEKWSMRKWLKRAVPKFAAVILRDTITSQIESGIDKAIAWQIRRYTKSYPKDDTGKLNPTSLSGWASHAEKAKQAINFAKDVDFKREFKKSEQHCKHFEETEGLAVTDTHSIFPLGRPITVFSGEVVHSPVYYLGFVVGYANVHYDENKNVLQIYYQGYSVSRQYSDVKFPGPYPSGLYVSSVGEGSEYDVDPDTDGRSDLFVKFEQPKDDRSMGIPFLSPKEEADFTLWSRPRAETCNPAVENDAFWEEIDLTKKDDSTYDAIVQTSHTLKGVVSGMPCANIWMRSDYGRGTHSFGLLEIAVWGHFLGEVPDNETQPLALAKWWDSWECFYHNKDQALCAED